MILEAGSLKILSPSMVRFWISLEAQTVKKSVCNAGDLGLIPRVRKIPWRREWLPTLVFLPGESHGQRSLAEGALQSMGVARSLTQLSDLSTTKRW